MSMIRGCYVLGLVVASVMGAASPAMAKDILVRMKNQGADGMMVFEPAYVVGAVGDTVHFLPTDPAHNAEPIVGMLPEGVTAPAGGINKEYVLRLSKPGVYGIKCKPHYTMGMVALVKAGPGSPSNLAVASAVKLPPLAARRMAPLLAKAK
jgi:pseudoazurin